MADKPDPHQTAVAYVDERYPDAEAGFLGGSVLRGHGTPSSDLDIIVVTTAPPAPFRETVAYRGWTIEAFVHSVESLRVWAAMDVERRKPVLPQLATEGTILVEGPLADQLRREMQQILDDGPPSLSRDQLNAMRYGVTDLVDDLADSPPGLERLTISAALVDNLLQLELDTAGQWTGLRKWGVRRLRELQPELADRLAEAAMAAAVDPQPLIALAEERLGPHGGRLLHGYRAEGQAAMDRWLLANPPSDTH